MLWIVDGGMLDLPIVARIEDWQEGRFIVITTGDEDGEWNDEPVRYSVRDECHETMVERFWRGCSECGYKWEHMYGIGKCVGPNFCPSCGRRVVEVSE